MCGYCKSFYILLSLLGQGYRDGCPSPVLYRHSDHKKRKNIFVYRGRNPPCGRQAGSAICVNASVCSTPVGHTETGHAQRGAVFVNGDSVRDGIRASPVGIQVDKRPDITFLAQAVSGIVVMGGVQADMPDGDNYAHCYNGVAVILVVLLMPNMKTAN